MRQKGVWKLMDTNIKLSDEQRKKLNAIFGTNDNEDDIDSISYWTDALDECFQEWIKDNCPIRPCNPYEQERYGWKWIFTLKGQIAWESKQSEIYKVWSEVFDEDPIYEIKGGVQEE